MKIIERIDYQNYLWDIKDTPDIKVITDICCGQHQHDYQGVMVFDLAHWLKEGDSDS